MFRKLKENINAMIDISLVLVIGVVFAGLMVIAYIVFTLSDKLIPTAPTGASTATYNNTYRSIRNITGGFDDTVALILIAITVLVLAIAIAALFMIRAGRQ